jgi:hypothetical protein
MGKNQTGKNNPNFGNKWTDEQRSQQSSVIHSLYENNPEYRYKSGSANRGVKFSKERINAMHGHRTSESYSHPHTEETKKLIGKLSANKWTDEFKKSYRKTMEENGHWVRLEDKEPYEIYYKESNWIGSMIEFFDEQEKDQLNKFGLFNQYNNTRGWVRDHIVSRMVGFEFRIPPQILRHPANMKFVSHGDNVSKGFVDRRLTENEKYETILALFERILSFEKEWKEHHLCLNYIRNNNEDLDHE